MSEIASIVQSPGWHCPVCDQRGSQHEPNCFVLELAAEVTQLQADLAEERRWREGNLYPSTYRDACESLRAAEAEAAQLRAELEHVGLDATMGHTRAMQLRAERDAAVERDDWLRKQLDGLIEDAEVVVAVTGLALARSVLGNLRDARAALAPAPEAETT